MFDPMWWFLRKALVATIVCYHNSKHTYRSKHTIRGLNCVTAESFLSLPGQPFFQLSLSRWLSLLLECHSSLHLSSPSVIPQLCIILLPALLKFYCLPSCQRPCSTFFSLCQITENSKFSTMEKQGMSTFPQHTITLAAAWIGMHTQIWTKRCVSFWLPTS